jgi:Domain of unknown function (DUF1844)
MPEQSKPFVVTDRRKFTMDGELRPDADPSPEREERAATPAEPVAPAAAPQAAATSSPETVPESEMPPPPTAEENDQARRAYEMTADRLDTAIRSANPGMDHPPAMSFEQLVQSIYMTAMMQLGAATHEGQQPQVDILGARQSIDMLAVLAEKTKGNLSAEESRLLDSALFELRMAFLEITQALARSAAAKAPAAGRPGPAGPSIVR